MPLWTFARTLRALATRIPGRGGIGCGIEYLILRDAHFYAFSVDVYRLLLSDALLEGDRLGKHQPVAKMEFFEHVGIIALFAVITTPISDLLRLRSSRLTSAPTAPAISRRCPCVDANLSRVGGDLIKVIRDHMKGLLCPEDIAQVKDWAVNAVHWLRQLIEHFGEAHVEPARKAFQCAQTGVDLTSLDVTDVLDGQATSFCHLFLSQAELAARRPHEVSKAPNEGCCAFHRRK